MTATDTRAEWLADRRRSMGASDIAAADTGRYGGAAKAVADKLGLAPDVDDIKPELADRGHRWEQPIADGVLAHFGLYVLGEQMLVRNPATPHVHATVDGMLSLLDGRPGREVSIDTIDANLEVKTRGPHAPTPWDYYRDQAQIGMHCTGARRCLLAVGTVDSDYDTTTGQIVEELSNVRYEWVERDDLEIARLLELAAELWAWVERGELPEPTGPEALPWVKAANIRAGVLCEDCGGTGLVEASEQVALAVVAQRRKCKPCDGKGRVNVEPPPELDDELSALIARREALAAARKESDDEAATIEAKLRHAIGDALEVRTADGRWRVRCGLPVRKFTGQAEADFLEIHGERAAELGLVRTVTVLDRDRAKVEMADDYDAFRVATPDRRLTVKNLRPEED